MFPRRLLISFAKRDTQPLGMTPTTPLRCRTLSPALVIARPLSDSQSPKASEKPSTKTTTSGKSKSKPAIVADSTMHFESAVRVIPLLSKAAKGGEDALFAHPFAIGVSDGVGGWINVGVDPSQFSRALVAGGLASAETNQRDPTTIMQAGHEEARAARGSATFCIVALDSSSAVLRSANLGDSGFALYRNGALVFRSKEQQHGFNFPFQLGENSNDTPNDADKETISVEPGDVVVVGSDGLFDNVVDEEITQVVGKHTNIDALADELAKLALTNSEGKQAKSPQKTRRYVGGKPDDITVVVAAVRGGANHSSTSVTGKDGKLVVGTSSLLISSAASAASGLFGLMQVTDFWSAAALSTIAIGLWQLKRGQRHLGNKK